VGQPAAIVLRSEPARRLPGHVARIEIQSDVVNEERLVEAGFDHVPPGIHLDEQSVVYITIGTLAHAVLVASLAVTGRKGTAGMVWILQSGRLRQQRVTLGPELLDGRLPVVAGLPAGAQVVVSPTSGRRAGRAAVVARSAGR
jgi:HlyD family secretion protein